MEKIKASQIKLEEVKSLNIKTPKMRSDIPDYVYKERLEKIRGKMQEKGLDCLVIYGDREHYSNFRYLAGYEPRFEEGILIVHKTGINNVLLGNECFGLYKESKIPVEPILCQILSLPNQTMEKFYTMEDLLEKAHITGEMKIGVVGWKLFTGTISESYQHQFDVPSYLVESLKNIVSEPHQLMNATALFISPEDGVRVTNDVHTIAYLEYGAAVASECLKEMQNHLALDMSEKELASYLNPEGLVLSCHSMVASGENRFRGLISPTDRKIKKGDAFSACMGMEGGLSSRNGYIAESQEDLDDERKDYLDKVAKPYYAAAASWYQTIAIGVTGGELYQAVNEIFPQEEYGWVLNPGHLIATEEWLSSPVYPGSTIKIKSGMIAQMDIIPDVAGYGSPGAEDGVCIADEALREEIKKLYPNVWERMQKRRTYMEEELGIKLHPEILPMSNLAGEYRPFMLNRKKAFKVVKSQ